MSRLTIEGDATAPFRIAAAATGRALAVSAENPPASAGSGVLTATPTVTHPDGTTETLDPIYLVITADGGGGDYP